MLQIESYFDEKNLLGILEQSTKLNNFAQFYGEVSYLDNLNDAPKHELFLFDTYESTLQVAATSTLPFKNFSQENYD